MGKNLLQISIPNKVNFADLKLARDSEGTLSFDVATIEAICAASGIESEVFMETHEDNVAGLIIGWYQAHIANGGEPDATAEDLMLEAKLEDQYGGGFSLPAGRA